MKNSLRRAKKRRQRRPIIEKLERRELLAAEWRNPVFQWDVNSDHRVSALDALLGINRMGRADGTTPGRVDLSSPRPDGVPYYDTNGNGELTAVDVLQVINALGRDDTLPIELEESDGFAVSRSILIGSGQEQGNRTYRFEIDAAFDTSDDASAVEDTLAVYVTDGSETIVDRGVGGTAVFTLSGDQADFVPGLVRYNGQVVEIDLTSLGQTEEAYLQFQLLNHDSDRGSRVVIRPFENEVDPDGFASPAFASNTSLVQAGESLDFGSLTASTTVTPIVSNIRFDSDSGLYQAELRIRNNSTEPIGRDVAIEFSGLGDGVSLGGGSGISPGGDPYLSFRNAIRPGGLDRGALSEAILVEFDISGNQAFTWALSSWLGAPNRAPMLAEVSPVTVSPGDTLDLQLSATDPDGDRVTFSFTPGARMPSISFDGNGAIQFQPTPHEVGTYQFDVHASDGMSRSTQTIDVTVSDLSFGATRISGTVLDVDGSPLAGIPIEVGRFQTLTDAGGAFELELPSFISPTEAFDIAVPVGDVHFDPLGDGHRVIPMFRAGFDLTTGTSQRNPRRHQNLVSTFIDASVVYGSDANRATALRTLDGSGKLKASSGDLLPINNLSVFPDGPLENENNSPNDPTSLFAAGDVRANENVALLSLHTLLLREHNRKADELAVADPGLSGDDLYQQARAWVTAILQQITYSEFLPLLLGEGAIPSYRGYDSGVDPSISGLFSGAAFRFGHSTAVSTLQRLDEMGQPLDGGALTLREAFFNAQALKDDGIEPYLRGMASQELEELDTKVIDDLRNFLFGPPGAGGLDLVSLNIQRGRDLGLPDYNQARRDVGLEPIDSFDEISSDVAVQNALEAVYGTVDDIDLWVGGLAEDHVTGAMVGELFWTIIRDQFIRLRDGDRFWFENERFVAADLDAIRSETLSSVITRNTSINTLPANVFTTQSAPSGAGRGGSEVTSELGDIRSFDGSGNNESDPTLGQTGTNLQTDYTLEYADGIAQPAGQDRISAREISNQVFAQSNSHVNSVGATNMFAIWGQLLTHDTNLTPGGTDNTLKVHGEMEPSDDVYPFIAEKLPLMLDHPVYVGYDNVIQRPIYLPVLDVAGGTPIDPSAMETTIVEQPIAANEMVALEVAAGSLETRDGAAFDGVLSITEVPPSRTPAALPAGSFPDTVVTIQPGEMVFTTPAPISFPNRAGWAAGTVMDLMSINPQTGEFEDVGDMVVSADGSRIETTSGGVRNSSWHYPDPINPNTNARNKDDVCYECEHGRPGASEVLSHTGVLMEEHQLATYQSLGQSRGVTLTYDSLRADPRPIISFGFDEVSGMAREHVLVAGSLIIDNRAVSSGGGGAEARFTYSVPGADVSHLGLEGPIHFWDAIEEDGDTVMSLQADLTSVPTGHMGFTVRSGLVQYDDKNDRLTGTIDPSFGSFIHVNEIESPFGAGWGISGLQKLVSNPDLSVVVVDGNGGELLFTPRVGFRRAGDRDTLVSPPGDFSVLERIPNGFRRTMRDQTVYTFETPLLSTISRLTSMRDRNGNETTYEYDAEGRIKLMTDPVGLETTFDYRNGQLASITDPAGRETKFHYDSRGDLKQIIDPDGTSRKFDYDTHHRMIGETDKRGLHESIDYRFDGRVRQATRRDKTEVKFSPLQIQALYEPEATTDLFNPPSAFRDLGTEATYVDANGNVTRTVLDRAGQEVTSFDAIGPRRTIVRNDENLIDQVIDARGNSTFYTYDDFGNVIRIADQVSPIVDVTPTIRWVGTAGGDWNERSNWDTREIPGPTDDVFINVDDIHATITITDDVVVNSLRSNEMLRIDGGSLQLSYFSRLQSGIDLRNEGAIRASGRFAEVSVFGETELDGGGLVAELGGKLTFESLTHASLASLETYLWEADGVASRISFPVLRSIEGFEENVLLVRAQRGGRFDLPLLNQVDMFLTVDVTDSGSLIQLDSLATIARPESDSELQSFVNAVAGGTILAPNLQSLFGVELLVDGPSLAGIPELREVFDGGIRINNGAELSLDQLQTIVETIVEVDGGANVELPSLTRVSYSSPSSSPNWTLASGAKIVAPKLTTWKNGSLLLDGASASFPKLRSIEIDDVVARGSWDVRVGSNFDAPNLSSWINGSIVLSGGAADLSNLAIIDAMDIAVSGGSVLRLGQVESALVRRPWTVEGAESVFDLPNLTELETLPNANAPRVRAENMGTISFGSLASIDGGTVRFEASGTGSAVNLPELTSYQTGVQPRGELTASSGGTFDLSSLEQLSGVFVTVDGSDLALPSLASLQSGRLSVSQGGSVTVPELSNIDQLSIEISDGFALALPLVDSAVIGASWIASGDDSEIALPNLTSVATSNLTNPAVRAEDGGSIRLAALTEISDAALRFQSTSPDSSIDLSNLTRFIAPALPSGEITAQSGGAIEIAQLSELRGVKVTADGSLLQLPELESLEQGLIQVAGGGNVDVPKLNSIDGSSVAVSGGVMLALPLISEYATAARTVFMAEGDGSRLELPALTLIDVDSNSNRSNVSAANGGAVELGIDHAEIQLNRVVVAPADTGVIVANLMRLNAESRLIGDGTVKSNLIVEGTVRPGLTAGNTPGRLTIDGDLTLGSDSRVEVGIGGLESESFDQVEVTGAAQIAGTLNVSLIDGFVPNTDDRFAVFATGSRSGEFDAVEGSDFGGGQTFGADYTDTAITLITPTVSNSFASESKPVNETDDDAILLDPPRQTPPPSDASTPESPATDQSQPSPSRSIQAEGEGDEPEIQPRTFTYDPIFNQPTSVTDELGRVTIYEIDPQNGNRLSMTHVVGEIDSESGETDDVVTRFTYTPQGLPDTMTDPLGRVTDYDYDTLGRLVQVTFAVGTDDEASQRFEYDLAGNQTLVVDENGNETRFEFDALNRIKQMIEADPDGPTGPLLSPVTSFDYDENGNQRLITDAKGNRTVVTFDPLDRPRTSTDELGEVTEFKYDDNGNLRLVIDELDHETKTEYDARDRVIASIDAEGGVTEFGYDLDNNLTSLIDPVNNKTRFRYGSRDRQIAEIDPLGNSIIYEYDAVDNLVTKTDRNQRVTDFVYDDLDRLDFETWLNTDDSIANEIDYEYDKPGNLLSASDNFSALTHTYDNRDRLVTVDNAGTPDAPNVVLTYTYDDVGNVLSVADNIEGTDKGRTIYTYDALNRNNSIRQSGEDVTDKRVDFAYNALGQYTSIDRYSDLAGTQNAVRSNYTYDALNRIERIQHANSTEVIAFYDYTYDQASRIKSIDDVERLTVYSYDDRNQLTGADRSDQDPRGDESYAYDANGNRESSHLHGDNYRTEGANRLVSDGEYSYEYDDEGNLIRRIDVGGSIRTFEWDHAYRLIRVTDYSELGIQEQTVAFAYDVFGRRTRKEIVTARDGELNTLTHSYVYDRVDVFLTILGSQDHATETLVFVERRNLSGSGYDNVFAESVSGETWWSLKDHLGTTRVVADTNGVPLKSLTLDSFGNQILQSNSSNSTRPIYAGREFDDSIGVYYYRSRYYDPALGRFYGEDRIGFLAVDVNLHRYVGNAPTMFTDPTGFERVRFDDLFDAFFYPKDECIVKCRAAPDEFALDCLKFAGVAKAKDPFSAVTAVAKPPIERGAKDGICNVLCEVDVRKRLRKRWRQMQREHSARRDSLPIDQPVVDPIDGFLTSDEIKRSRERRIGIRDLE